MASSNHLPQSFPESAEQERERRLQRRRERERARRASETAEQREERLSRRRVRDRARRAAQSVEQRQACLQRRRDRLNAESAEEREARLQQMRDRLAAESAGEREARLQQIRDRLAAESAGEREARLQRIRDRLAAESAGQREARLQRMRINQSERLAAESLDEREDRLHRASEREPHPNREQPFKQRSVQVKMRRFHDYFANLNSPKCSTCSESFPGIQLRSPTTECMRCYRDKHTPKLYSSANGMDPGPLPSQLQDLTQVEEMLISAVLPIMSLYKLPHGQYAYSGHVINLPQDVASFANSLPHLPSELDVIIVRKEGAADSHRDFRVRRAVVLRALQWLVANNKYYRNVRINQEALAVLPEDGDLSGLRSVTVDSTNEDTMSPSTLDADEDPYNTHLSGSFVPSTTQRMTEQETVRQTVQERQSQRQPAAAPPTVSWPPSGSTPINEFNTEGYMSCAFPTLFPTGAADFLAPRPLSVTIGNYLKHMMMFEDGRFARRTL